MRETARSKPSQSQTSTTPAAPAAAGGRRWYLWLILVAAAAVVLLALRPRTSVTVSDSAGIEGGAGGGSGAGTPASSARDRAIGGLRRTQSAQDGGQGPEAVVANRLQTFANSRRDIVLELARRTHGEVPNEVDRFFEAVQSGNWADIKGLYMTLSAQRRAPETSKALEALWPAVVDTFGAAAVATAWPPTELLAYGESVVTSLKPGTIYLSGTDVGRNIPSLFAGGGASAPMVIGPDTFADPAQLEYLALAYPDRFGSINRDDIDRILKRDQAPVDGKSVAGVDPKSARQEILKALIEKNPGLTFAVDGSFNLGELGVDLVPSGPILEIRPGAGGGGASMPSARAADTAEYWRATAQRLETEASLPPDSSTRREYSQMALAQARLLSEQNLAPEAERTYRAALQMAPSSYDPLDQLTTHLAQHGQLAEANTVMDDFIRTNPGQAGLVNELRKRIQATPPKNPR